MGGVSDNNDEIVGGELHVRIVSGSRVLNALLHRRRHLSSESRRLKVCAEIASCQLW